MLVSRVSGGQRTPAAFVGGDPSSAEMDFCERVSAAAVEAGAKEVVVVDTLGIASPEAVAELVGKTVEWVGPGIPVHFHGHNDFGVATASAVAAVRAGASYVHETTNGVGGRAGHADLGADALTVRARAGAASHAKTASGRAAPGPPPQSGGSARGVSAWAGVRGVGMVTVD